MIKYIAFIGLTLISLNSFADSQAAVPLSSPQKFKNNPTVGSKQSSYQIFGGHTNTGPKPDTHINQTSNPQNNPNVGSKQSSNQAFNLQNNRSDTKSNPGPENSSTKGSVSSSGQLFGN